MAYDEGMAERLREIFYDHPAMDEKKMFGALCFMLRGHMCLGVDDERLMVRVGAEQYEKALALPHAHEFDFTGKPLRGFIYGDADGYESDEGLQAWIDLAMAFNKTLKAK